MPALQQRKILVTRPAGLEHVLMRLIDDAGGTAIHLPVIAIVPPLDDSSREYARQHLDDFDIAIFISPTAVKQTLAYLDFSHTRLSIAAIGSRSQQALEDAGLTVTIQPQGHDSESLLKHPGLQRDQVQHRNIVIFRGEDGRDALRDELQKRGASVTYAAMYTRVRTDTRIDPELLGSLDAITVSSNEGLQNLYDIVKDSGTNTDDLLAVRLFVPGQRALQLARVLGFEHIVVADNATDQAMYRALEQKLA